MRRRDRLLVITLALLAPAAAYAQSTGLGAGTPDMAMVYPQGGATSPGLDFIFSTNAGTALWYQPSTPSCVSAATCLTTTRATTNGSATNLLPTSPSGQTITTFADNTARLSSVGLIVEGAAVNQLLNATAPVTQTTASISCASPGCTLWVNGSGSATASAGTATGCSGFAAATNGASNTFICTGAGTITVTVSGSLNAFQLEIGGFGTSLCTSGASACSRGADVITVSVSAIGASYTEFGAATPMAPISFASNQTILNVSDGTNTNRSAMTRGASVGTPGATQAGTGGTLVNFAFNGTLGGTPVLTQNVAMKGAVTLSSASGMTTLNIGNRPDGALQLYGTLQRVAIWPTVALTAAQLTALTK